MMKLVARVLFIFFSASLLLYMAIPGKAFPLPPSDALKSQEPADTEDQYREAYFTNYSREEVINHYKMEFSWLPFVRLNYPPEDAQTIIRDQTRSSYLEEIVHPFRESVYVNGFKPTKAKDAILIEGKNWEQKITVRYVPSSLTVRLIFALLAIGSVYFVGKEWGKFINEKN